MAMHPSHHHLDARQRRRPPALLALLALLATGPACDPLLTNPAPPVDASSVDAAGTSDGATAGDVTIAADTGPRDLGTPPADAAVVDATSAPDHAVTEAGRDAGSDASSVPDAGLGDVTVGPGCGTSSLVARFDETFWDQACWAP